MSQLHTFLMNESVSVVELSDLILDKLSQPICASNLNIQLLKMQMDKKELTSDLSKDIIMSLEVDLQRMIAIVKSVRISLQIKYLESLVNIKSTKND